MQSVFRIICFSMFLCLSVPVIFSQRQNTDNLTADKKTGENYLLVTKKSDLKFNQGEEVRIEMILKNASDEDIYFVRSNVLDDFFLEIKDKNLNAAPFRQEVEYGKLFPKTGSTYAVRLKPNEEYAYSIVLSSLYSLQKGAYTLTADCLIYKKDKKNARTVKLKPITILIS